jgi:hypothetical protein
MSAIRGAVELQRFSDLPSDAFGISYGLSVVLTPDIAHFLPLDVSFVESPITDKSIGNDLRVSDPHQ